MTIELAILLIVLAIICCGIYFLSHERAFPCEGVFTEESLKCSLCDQFPECWEKEKFIRDQWHIGSND